MLASWFFEGSTERRWIVKAANLWPRRPRIGWSNWNRRVHDALKELEGPSRLRFFLKGLRSVVGKDVPFRVTLWAPP